MEYPNNLYDEIVSRIRDNIARLNETELTPKIRSIQDKYLTDEGDMIGVLYYEYINSLEQSMELQLKLLPSEFINAVTSTEKLETVKDLSLSTYAESLTSNSGNQPRISDRSLEIRQKMQQIQADIDEISELKRRISEKKSLKSPESVLDKFMQESRSFRLEGFDASISEMTSLTESLREALESFNK